MSESYTAPAAQASPELAPSTDASIALGPLALANKYGVTDSGFRVMVPPPFGENGDPVQEDKGWSVTGEGTVTDRDTGQRVPALKLTSVEYAPNGKTVIGFRETAVRPADLTAWNASRTQERLARIASNYDLREAEKAALTEAARALVEGTLNRVLAPENVQVDQWGNEIRVDEVGLDPNREDSEDEYARLLNPEFDMEALLVENAAVKGPGTIFEQLGAITTDEYGVKRIKGPEALANFNLALEALGVVTQAPTAEELVAMHAKAEQLVKTGRALAVLDGMQYIPRSEIGKLTKNAKKTLITWGGDGSLYIDPSKIVSGDASLLNWSGRGETHAKLYTTSDGAAKKGSIGDAIQEYAAKYASQLPPLENTALNVVLTKDGPICFVNTGVNRTAAAKLRGEPLRFTTMVLHDAR